MIFNIITLQYFFRSFFNDDIWQTGDIISLEARVIETD